MRQVRADDYQEFAAARAGHLYRSACLLTGGDTHLAEDLAQETLGRLYVKHAPIGVLQHALASRFHEASRPAGDQKSRKCL